MPVVKGLEWTFNTVAEEYDKCNPNYVPELYEDIFSYKKITELDHALEIGIGTGQATEPILKTDCTVTAVELGDNLAAFARKKFEQYPKFSVVTTSFQDYECADNTYDLIYSARAFHWIAEEIGYPKVYHMLKPGGVFARFANHPYKDKGRPEIHEAMQKLYAIYMPGSLSGPEYTEEAAIKRADIASKYGFTDIKHHLYHRTRSFTSTEYIQLLGTYSDHIALPPQTRKKFFLELQQTIQSLGNIITLYDTIDLELALKP